MGEGLDTSALTGVRIYEPGSLTLVAGAATPLAEVEAVLASERQRLAFEVPDMRGLLRRNGVSTLGGVVAAGASGPRRVQVGACRDHVLGVRFVNGAGVPVKAGGRVMKNVTGLDLTKLMVGSHGRLGVITEVAFRVQALPEAEVTLRAARPLAEGLAGAAGRAWARPWMSAGRPSGRVQAMMRLEGMAGSVAYRAQALTGAAGRRLGGGHGRRKRRAVAGRARCQRLCRAGRARSGGCRSSRRMRWRWSTGLDAEALFDWGGGLIWLLTRSGGRSARPCGRAGSCHAGQGGAGRCFSPKRRVLRR